MTAGLVKTLGLFVVVLAAIMPGVIWLMKAAEVSTTAGMVFGGLVGYAVAQLVCLFALRRGWWG